MDIADLDPHALQSVMKIGGKKKLDTLIQMLKEHGPQRLNELDQSNSLGEAQSAAKVLKNSAINLGLSSLENCCDEILAASQWNAGSPLAAQAKAAYQRGLAALMAERGKI
jgi:HPt (histidine-containing phosphotransfer) domain-containing protein